MTNNYLIVNGKVFSESVTVSELKQLKTRYRLKLVKSWTFQRKDGLRRVLKYESQGTVYSVSGPVRWIDYNAWTRSHVLMTFEKRLAYQAAERHKGEVMEFNANEIDFTLKEIKRYF